MKVFLFKHVNPLVDATSQLDCVPSELYFLCDDWDGEISSEYENEGKVSIHSPNHDLN